MLPTPPVAPVTMTGPLAGASAVPLQVDDRQRRREAGRADRHHVEQRQTLRHRHDPVRRHAHVFGVAAVVRHAEVVAGDEHLVARLEARIAARLDRAGHVDAADQRKAAHDLSGAGRGQRVLVVHARERGLDDHRALAQILEGQLHHAAVDRAAFVEHAIRVERSSSGNLLLHLLAGNPRLFNRSLFLDRRDVAESFWSGRRADKNICPKSAAARARIRGGWKPGAPRCCGPAPPDRRSGRREGRLAPCAARPR